MAKASGSNIIEKYIDKAVLGVCALLLIYGLLHWGFSSSRLIGPGEQSPDKIDDWLQQQAETAKRASDLAEPGKVQSPQYLTAMAALLKPPMTPAHLQLVDFSSPRLPVITRTIPDQKLPWTPEDLAAVAPAPTKPEVIACQVLPRRENPLQDIYVANIICVYPFKKLSDEWEAKLKRPPVPAALEQQIEIQEQDANGNWTKAPRTVKVDRFIDPKGVDKRGPVLPPYTGSNAEAVQQAIVAYRKIEFQQMLLQPDQLEVYWLSTDQWVDWRVNLKGTELAKTQPKDVVPAGVDAPVLDATPAAGPTPTPTPGRPARGAAIAPAQPVAAMMAARPSFDKQLEGGLVEVWSSDNQVESGKSYRARVRLRLINPLLANENDLAKPEGGRIASIDTPFSPWSDTFSVPRNPVFFVDKDAGKGRAGVHVFSVFLGQHISHRFQVEAGQLIGGKEKKPVKDPMRPGTAPVQKEVDLSTGCVVVAINAKPIYRSGTPATTLELVYVDAAGQLQQRRLDQDSVSPEMARRQQLQAHR